MDVESRHSVFMVAASLFAVALLVALPGCEQEGASESAQKAVLLDPPPESPELNDQVFQAILDDDELLAIDLIERGASVHTLDDRGISVLHFAARSTMPELTRVLLQFGADVNVAYPGNIQPIHWAARAGASNRPGAKETIEVLLEYGADINARTDGGTLPITYAVMLDNEEWRQYLISLGSLPE